MYEKINGSLGEFCERYLGGEVFYQMDSGHGYDLGSSVSASSLLRYYQGGVYTKSEPKWYENLGEGEGVLCWVWDEFEEDKCLGIISKYEPESCYKYVGTGTDRWENAKPLTSRKNY